MGRDNRCLGNLHDIPESLVADVTDIHKHTKTLSFSHVFPADIGKTSAGHMGTCQRILLIPAQGRNPKSNLIQVLQKRGVKSKSGSALNGQNRGHHSGLKILRNIFRAVSQPDQILVSVQLPLDGGQLPFKHDNRRNLVPLLKARRCKTGKALTIPRQFRSPFQVNMQLVAPQASRLVQIFSQEGQCGIAVKVKNRKTH